MEIIYNPTFEDFCKERFIQSFNETKAQFPDTQGDIVLVTEEYYDRALWMAQHAFHAHEPVIQSIGLQWSEEIKMFWLDTLSENLTFMIVDRDTGEPMCMRATSLKKKGQEDVDPKMFDSKAQTIHRFLHFCEEKACFWEKHNADWCINLFALCTSPKYCKKGLATVLMKFTLAVFQNLRMFPLLIKGKATSHFSKIIYDKLNFDTISDTKYSEYKENGVVVFDNTSPHTALYICSLFINKP